MKKIINLTKNEVDDVISEDKDNRPKKYPLFTINQTIKYQTENKHPHWKSDDEYKVIEI